MALEYSCVITGLFTSLYSCFFIFSVILYSFVSNLFYTRWHFNDCTGYSSLNPFVKPVIQVPHHATKTCMSLSYDKKPRTCEIDAASREMTTCPPVSPC